MSRRLPWLLLPLLAAAFLIEPVFSGLILGRGDTFAYFYPYWDARNTALAAGQLPLWTPELFMGVPLLANSQLGTFYPPNWLVMPFAAPDAIKISIFLHITWALAGAYLLAREWLGVIPALGAAAVFALGGYVGAHVEQINQLQGIAWLPWLFWLYERVRRVGWRGVPLLGMALALQFLTGHTQTVFISGVGLLVYGLFRPHSESRTLRARGWGEGFVYLALAGLIALVLAAPQIVPTFELTDVSNRRGGLTPNEATAFSLNPLLIGRGLLPSYEAQVFGEYIAYVGVIGLGLAALGIMRGGRLRWPWLALAVSGLLLALGEFNPLYWQLAALPGFNLFRVPARWLALYALGVAMLAGWGLQSLALTLNPSPSGRGTSPPRADSPPSPVYGGRVGDGGLAILIIAALAAASLLAPLAPPQEVTGPAQPTALTWGLWALALVAFLVLAWRRWVLLLAAALVMELFAASRVLPYNTLVPPEIYQSQRFTTSQMLAYADEQTPPGRMLSISQLYFDPGDRAALEARFAALSPLERDIAMTGIKAQEVLAANLPLTWGVPSIDGFDGGVLPTQYYTAFTSLMLPPDSLRTIDGRLRENMARPECRGACIPDQRWLNLTGTQYLITDKIYDLWHNDIAYDMQFAVTINGAYTLPALPDFTATALDVLVAAGDPADLRLSDPAAATGEPITALDGMALYRYAFTEPLNPGRLTLTATSPVTIRALTLVDTRTGSFVQPVPDANWQRVLSSDIKIYQNRAVLPRAFVVHQVDVTADDIYGTEAALDIMRDSGFDPARQAVLHGDVASPLARSTSDPTRQPPPGIQGGGESDPVGGEVSPVYGGDSEGGSITTYTPEHISIQVQADAPGYLIFTDAYYPGWRATVNGAAAPIYRADVMFRAVAVPAGESEVVFRYQPAWRPGVLIGGGVAWLLALAYLLFSVIQQGNVKAVAE